MAQQAHPSEDTAFRVMRLLQANPDLTQRELAQELGVSVGGMNYCLKALIDKGWVKMYNFSQSKNKFGYVYILTPSPSSSQVRSTAFWRQSNCAKRAYLWAQHCWSPWAATQPQH